MALHSKYGKPMSPELKAAIWREGLRPSEFIVKQDYKQSAIICHVITGECKVIYK